MTERDDDHIVKLIRLKRFEKPREGYFEDFVSEFQCRQRSELLRRSAHGIFFERVATYFSSFGGQPWLIGAGAAAVLTVSLVLLQSADTQSAGGTAASQLMSGEENVLWGADFALPEPSMERVYPVFDESRMGFGELIPVSNEPPRDF